LEQTEQRAQGLLSWSSLLQSSLELQSSLALPSSLELPLLYRRQLLRSLCRYRTTHLKADQTTQTRRHT
jgi:hypothetical protein